MERTGRDVSWERVARRFFERRELEALEALPAAARRPAFFRGWTRKEAFVKATGRGVTQGLRTFAVSLDPGAASLLWMQDGAPRRLGHGRHRRRARVQPPPCAPPETAGRSAASSRRRRV